MQETTISRLRSWFSGIWLNCAALKRLGNYERMKAMSNMVKYTGDGELDLQSLSNALVKSGYFSDVKDASQAMVKVLAGQEMGLSAIASMTGIYIVKGRVTLSANLMASLVKRSGRYNYRVTEMSNERVSITFYEQGQECGVSSFSADDAKAAGLWGSSDPWKKSPRNMLFARAMSNGVKWFCPDIGSGPMYTPDELQDTGATYAAPTLPPAQLNISTGEIIEAEVIDERAEALGQMRVAFRAARAVNPDLPTPDKAAVAAMSLDEIRDWIGVYQEMAQPQAEDELNAENF
jgi:hypothetical protein